MSLSHILLLLNYGIVLLYGVYLTASFSGVLRTKKDWWKVFALSLPLMLLQTINYWIFGLLITQKYYPFIVHLPLAILVMLTYRKKLTKILPAVLIAYLCCVPRQWLGFLVSTFFDNNQNLNFTIQILISIPLMLLTIRFLSPIIQHMLNSSNKLTMLLTLPAAIYYFLIYLLSVYTNLINQNRTEIMLFILSVMIISYFFFTILYFLETAKRNHAENQRELLRLSTEQAVNDLETMRLSQQQAATYRHDIRHHFHYLSSCLQSEKTAEMKNYIDSICKDLENQQMIHYCENESVNLILSIFHSKVIKAGVEMEIVVTLSDSINLPTNDLCVILSNGLENALNAAQKCTGNTRRLLHVQGYQKTGKTFFQIQNPYNEEIIFEDDRPIAKCFGHGFGTLSIVETVKKLGGISSFSAKDGLFTLRFCI